MVVRGGSQGWRWGEELLALAVSVSVGFSRQVLQQVYIYLLKYLYMYGQDWCGLVSTYMDMRLAL